MRRDPAGLAAPGPDDGPPVDPLADLLFTLIAAVLPAIFLLAPLLQSPSLADVREVRPASAARAVVVAEGRRAETIVAGASGLRLVGEGGRLVGLDAISDDPDLRASLDRLRDGGEPLVLIVEPDGLDSAFLLEPLLASRGVAAVSEVRAAATCRSTRDPALRLACGAGPAAAR